MAPKTRARKSVPVKEASTDVLDFLSKDLKPVDKFNNVFHHSNLPSSDDDNDDNWTSRKRKSTSKISKSSKRKKATAFAPGPAPVAPEMSDHEMDDTEHEPTIYDANSTMTDFNAGIELVTSAQGPLIKLNLAKMLAQNNDHVNELIRQSGIKLPAAAVTKKSFKCSTTTSFATLPLELTRKIYRALFVTRNPIAFTDRDDFARSAALLRTCRRIHDEGTEVLYGENAFHFNRARHVRGAYWEKTWTEIGYKDVRRFLNDIGPHNVAKLKYVSMEFEDGSLGTWAALPADCRRFVHDPVLIQVLDMLAVNTVLEKFAVSFRGRTATTVRDYHFLKALCAIQTHKFEMPNVYGANHIDIEASRKVNTVMSDMIEPAKVQGKKEKGLVPAMMHEMLTRSLKNEW